jgi:hypothetical protein
MVQAPGSPVLVETTERDRIFGEFEELLEEMYNSDPGDDAAARRLLTMLEGLSASDQAAICRVVCRSSDTFPGLMVGYVDDPVILK